VFKKGTLGDLRDQVAVLENSAPTSLRRTVSND